MAGSSSGKQHVFQAPRGTRDFYPAEMLRRRWIEEAWRRTSIRHGFEEIDGPRFEHADLYTVKSGEGILSELFSFTRAGGETRFALRPEFTPTLARMVAAKAASLPKPIKWFSVGPYFRAERPQRGRLREFLQWNVDLLGSAEDDEATKARQDAEVIACCVEMLRESGFKPDYVKVRIGQREIVEHCLESSYGAGLDSESYLDPAFALLDKRAKMDESEFKTQCESLGIDLDHFDELSRSVDQAARGESARDDEINLIARPLIQLRESLEILGVADWIEFDCSGIVRGLAYYTGMVFEVHAFGGKERAIAGGGRYDKLVQLFGGPPTPAVGFAMGDVVLGNLAEGNPGALTGDHTPSGVFVVPGSDLADDIALSSAVAELRRRGIRALRSYKSTRNLKKLLREAHAASRFVLILNDRNGGSLKDMFLDHQVELRFDDVANRLAAYHIARECAMDDVTFILNGMPFLYSYIRDEIASMQEDAWVRRQWTPSDAVSRQLPSGFWKMSPEEQDRVRASLPSEVIPGGWDHEHCSICMWTLEAREDEPQSTIGYQSLENPQCWICDDCYEVFMHDWRRMPASPKLQHLPPADDSE